jgi:hypothetical protein
MKRQRQRRERAEIEDQHFARAALEELREVWQADRQGRTRRPRESTRLMRLAAETRQMLALWSYYRLACLDSMDGGRMGLA